jgi:hypothetical protein
MAFGREYPWCFPSMAPLRNVKRNVVLNSAHAEVCRLGFQPSHQFNPAVHLLLGYALTGIL